MVMSITLHDTPRMMMSRKADETIHVKLTLRWWPLCVWLVALEKMRYFGTFLSTFLLIVGVDDANVVAISNGKFFTPAFCKCTKTLKQLAMTQVTQQITCKIVLHS